MGSSEKTLCRVPLFACLAPIPWGGRWQAIPSLQITAARFGKPGETKADFGYGRPVTFSRWRTFKGLFHSRKLPKDLLQHLGQSRQLRSKD